MRIRTDSRKLERPAKLFSWVLIRKLRKDLDLLKELLEEEVETLVGKVGIGGRYTDQEGGVRKYVEG